jgi:hypothetical protein
MGEFESSCSPVDLLVVVSNDIRCEVMFACQIVARLANHNAFASDESRNAKIKHRVMVGAKHEHV